MCELKKMLSQLQAMQFATKAFSIQMTSWDGDQLVKLNTVLKLYQNLPLWQQQL